MPLCALGEFSRGFMMATIMSGLFICGQTDHSAVTQKSRIGPAVPGTECSAASRRRAAPDMHRRNGSSGAPTAAMMLGEKGKHPPTPHPHHPT